MMPSIFFSDFQAFFFFSHAHVYCNQHVHCMNYTVFVHSEHGSTTSHLHWQEDSAGALELLSRLCLVTGSRSSITGNIFDALCPGLFPATDHLLLSQLFLWACAPTQWCSQAWTLSGGR
jgi:hypothetical protein